MPVCAIDELTLAQATAMLEPFSTMSCVVTDSPVDTSEVFVESFLRMVSADAPVRGLARIVGRVEFRAGEGPLFEIGLRAVVIETTWADAMFIWSDGEGHEIAAMPLSSLSRYIVQGCVVLGP